MRQSNHAVRDSFVLPFRIGGASMSNRSTRTDADPPALKRLYWEVVSGLKRATWRGQRPFGENHGGVSPMDRGERAAHRS